MKKFSNIINESRGDDINEQWLNDEQPVMTKDGRQAIVLDIDRSVVPNIIKGQVKIGDKLFDYQWEDSGKCIKAVDHLGNPSQPDTKDRLVRAI